MRKIFTLLLLMLGIQALRAQTNRLERVIAEVFYLNDPGNGLLRIDSMHYIYSGSRHSAFNYSCDFQGFHYTDFNKVAQGLNPDFLTMAATPNSYDSAIYPDVYFDTLHAFLPDTSGRMLPFSTLAATYNPDGTFQMVRGISAMPQRTTPDWRQVMLYNAGRIAKVYYIRLDSGILDTACIRTVDYDASGRVVLDSLWGSIRQSTIPWIRTTFTYSGAGGYQRKVVEAPNLLGLTDTSIIEVNTYDTDGRLSTMSRFIRSHQGPMWPESKDSFTYLPGMPGFLDRYTDHYSPIDGQYDGSRKWVTNRLSPGNKKDSVTLTLYYRDGAWSFDDYSFKFTYNAAGNPVLVEWYNCAGQPPWVEAYTRWYYEPYDVGVKGPPSTVASFSISPNPTTGSLSLYYPGARPGASVSVRITNSAGQLVHAESISMRGASEKISLGDEAAPGTYYISVFGADGASLGSKSVIKL